MSELSTPLHHQLKKKLLLLAIAPNLQFHPFATWSVRITSPASLEDFPRLDIAVETILLGVARWLQPPGKDELGCITLSSCRFGGVESRKPPLLTHPLFAVKTSHHRNLDL
jgi:hypothetical protein